ncbi:MAG TPA: aminotransferase class V-fold PLP-dependent enzyme [Gammaproteobacteria bacterium]|nr:aminotransferase class V-fold PLP-dependent enzyme [Gammaproteobacteria bacterium]HIP03706.1 aminotransferase class V-fold PLP-dependent enzyme [Gammaproteobacteria bacterium]
MTEEVLYRPDLWSLDPDVLHLNHGSFGACPNRILEQQTQLRQQMEYNTLRFFEQDLPDLLETAREALGLFLGAPASDLVFVDNATMGVTTVLSNLNLIAGDRVLITDHGYNACSNAARFFAEKTGAVVDLINLPFPGSDSNEVIERILKGCTSRTRILLIDHITSPTALIMPLEDIVPAVQQRGIQVLVDGAHAPGMLPLRLAELGADYYTGNCHKWMCAPKGTAFLYVRSEHQSNLHPLTISHGMNRPVGESTRFRLEFDWIGTRDLTGFLTLPALIDYMDGISNEGWAGIMVRNRALAVEARDLICQELGLELPCPVDMIGSLATICLPGSVETTFTDYHVIDPLKQILRRQYGIEVSLSAWPSPAGRYLRISTQLYNALSQYRQLTEALQLELGRGH